jgi:hypothetical protein
MIDTPQRSRGHPSRQVMETQHQKPRTEFKLGWLLVPLALLGMFYLLQHTRSVVTWEQIMGLLHVHNRERYTMLFHLCLALVFVVAAVRILGRKGDK